PQPLHRVGDVYEEFRLLVRMISSCCSIRQSGTKKSKAAGVVWIVPRSAAVRAREIDKHHHRKVAGGGHLSKLHGGKYSFFGRVAVDNGREVSRSQFCFFGHRSRDAYLGAFSDGDPLFDIEPDIGASFNST